MTNIRDWNVSRQLWWGHRIPAWYCPDGHATVSAEPDGPSACEVCGRPAAELVAGPRHLRHLVQLGPVAVLDPRLAGADRRPRPLLPGLGHGDGLRHRLLLGGPDDDAGHRADRRGSLPHRLPVGPDPRPVRQEDVEDEGQHRRSAGHDRGAGCRRAALRPRPRRDPGQRPALRRGQGRERPQLRQQAVERHPLRPRCAAGDDPRRNRASTAGSRPSRTGGPLGPVTGGGDDRRRGPRDGRRTTSAKCRASSTRRSGASTATGASSSRRSGSPIPTGPTPSGRRRGGRLWTRSMSTCGCSIRSCRSSRSGCGRPCRTPPTTRAC